MALEKRWEAVSQLFTADGTLDGIIQVSDASNFFAKQKVTLTSDTLQPRHLEVKRVTPTTIQVGDLNTPIDKYIDVSDFLLIDNAKITANEQLKPGIKPEEILQALYQRDPAVALRNLLVDKFGIPIDSVTGNDGKKRLAVDAAVSVSGISVDLDALTPATRPDPDNILMAGSEDGLKTGLKHAARVDSELDLRVGISKGANKANVNAFGQLYTYDSDNYTALVSILSVLNGILRSISVGTEDGTTTGVQHVFVNNLKQMILATHNRVEAYTYADFGTKDERITQINYTSATFPGFTARKSIAYTLVSGKYRRDSITWSII